ncbi:hypothetical protein CMO89_04690 [Candidatus Woesearchaeota archaeon]|nr:hypothetical protein [Candidatus Woesearchaeota archaeon]|tara:strand:- start:105 stop:1784 length:1680 start_codon:yes stop_codon:yes gene_type:complete
MAIFRSIRNLQRFEHILNTLLKYELGHIIQKLKLKHHLPLHKRLQRKKFEEGNEDPKKVRLVFEELGGAFTKLAQLLSVRPDLIPMDYVKELEKLQDRVPPVPFEGMKAQIEKELKKPLDEIFSYFNKKPIASASIAQVYEAKLKNGERVAVKVQRPKIKELMEEDISIMYFLAEHLEKHIPKLRDYSPISVIKEFETWTRNELDFKMEARHAVRFYYNFKGSKTVRIPKVYSEFTTRDVLTLEYIDGTELHNLGEIKRKHYNVEKLIRNGTEAILTQIFVHGFFHADPHPGNILVSKGNVISFVDFGIVGYFDDELKKMATNLFYGIVEDDLDMVMNVFIKMGMSTKEASARFKMDLEDLIRPLKDGSLKKVKVSYVLEDVFELVHKHKVKLPIDFILFGKTVVTLEGLALRYCQNFRITKYSKPFLKKLERYGIENAKKEIIKTGIKYKDLVKTFPERTLNVFKKLEAGSIKVDIEDTDIKRLTLEMDKSSNRLTYGLIIASLIIASALISYIGRGPMLYGLSVFSIFGFGIAVMLGLFLVGSIMKKEKKKGASEKI